MNSDDVSKIVSHEMATYMDQIIALRAVVRAYKFVFLDQIKIKRADLVAAIINSEEALGLTADQKEVIYTLLKQD